MSIDEAITHCLEVADGQTAQGKCPECAEDHRQLAEWLTDYKRLKERESCGDCISRAGAMRAITDEWVRGKHTLEGFTAALYNLPPVIPKRAESKGAE